MKNNELAELAAKSLLKAYLNTIQEEFEKSPQFQEIVGFFLQLLEKEKSHGKQNTKNNRRRKTK